MEGGREMLRTVLSLLVVLSTWVLAPLAQAQEPFGRFLESLWLDASRPPYAVSRATFDRATRGLTPDTTLPDLEIPGRPPSRAKQAEFVRPPQDYLNAHQLSGLANQGRILAVRQASVISSIEKEIGVEGPIVLAIWGRETAFGTYRLPHEALRVLATQAWVGRRKDMFRTEFLYALKMIEDKNIDA